jgi:hypothetical protein
VVDAGRVPATALQRSAPAPLRPAAIPMSGVEPSHVVLATLVAFREAAVERLKTA